eukprot:scaffold533418_cov28-Prasinocladus_malaysianus.AAC.1
MGTVLLFILGFLESSSSTRLSSCECLVGFTTEASTLFGDQALTGCLISANCMFDATDLGWTISSCVVLRRSPGRDASARTARRSMHNELPTKCCPKQPGGASE